MISEQIRQAAKQLDDAVERQDLEEALSFFSDDCEIEWLGLKLSGKAGLRRALGRMFKTFREISFTPITIMIEGAIFFEEFTFMAKTRAGRDIAMKQAEVLIYGPDYRVRSLSLYFDGLQLAEAIAANPLERWIIKRMIGASTREFAR
jgi:ketosteroid isomerase-like protein